VIQIIAFLVFFVTWPIDVSDLEGKTKMFCRLLELHLRILKHYHLFDGVLVTAIVGSEQETGSTKTLR